jgi:YrbI family 3-deoxy-D-manno-octulosonate 8-phosphate phosphatase
MVLLASPLRKSNLDCMMGGIKVDMKIVALIPARGGSKGIPGKNLKIVGGLPLVARSVLAARGAMKIDQTYVSSDSSDILLISESYGALPIYRPALIAKDESSTEDVLCHFLTELKTRGELPEILVYLQCTSPFTTSADVSRILQALLENPAVDCAFSAIQDHAFLWEIDGNGVGKGINHAAYSQRKRRQDIAERSYRENGAVYAIRVNAFMDSNNRFCRAALPVSIDRTLPFEIDDPFELDMARQLSCMFPQPGTSRTLQSCRAVVMDFDGVLTNDKVIVSEFGHESVVCSRADGLGIGMLKKAGLRILILTKEENPVVHKRAEKIDVEIISGAHEKLTALKTWAVTNELNPAEIAYVGNDVNDLKCIEWVGFPFAPSDAHPQIVNSGCIILSKSGGEGVIRELADIILHDLIKV